MSSSAEDRGLIHAQSSSALMNPVCPQPGVGVPPPSELQPGSKSANVGGDAAALKGIFRLLCICSIYLLLVELVTDIISVHRLVAALLNFIPFCLSLVLVVVFARPVVKLNRATVLMGLFLVCISIVFLLDVTRLLPWLDRVPVIGSRNHSSRDLQSILMFVAVGCFLTGGYFMLEEVVLGKLRLQEQLHKLQEVEAILAESEERFRTLVERAPDGIYVEIQGRFAYLNSTALTLFRATAVEQLLNRPILEPCPPDHGPALSQGSPPLDQEKKTVPLSEQKFLRLDGTAFDVASSAVPFVFKNQNGTLVFFRDITERKRAEEALREAQAKLKAHAEDLEKTVARRTVKLRETIAELEHFSYAITHDMRAPLRAMQGFADLIEEECASCQHNLSQKYVTRIKAAALRMDQLITDSLDYSKAVRQELMLEPVDLGEVLSALVESYPNLQPDKADIVIESNLPTVIGNQAALTQCFSNLLGNAVKFSRPGTKPAIRVWAEGRSTPPWAKSSATGDVQTPMYQPSFEPPTGQAYNPQPGGSPERPREAFVRIWVEDKGIGIDKDAHQRIFGMFQRAAHGYDGTGIGLAIVRKVVLQMGGEVGVESDPGQGSRFWVDLRTAAPLALRSNLAH